MDNKTQTPAQVAITVFGGVRKLAKAINRDPAAVSRWQKSGMIPNASQQAVLESAWRRGLEISSDDIIFGRSE